MSDLLNAASLIMIPSGYSEDKVYSAVPTDGSGDLSFTRASNGTRINSAGLVEVTPWNLMSYSEQFDNAFWNKATSGSATFVVTANQTTAPNGTNTADLVSITRSATSELAAIYTSVGQGIGTFKNSIWLKAKDNSNVGKTIDLWSWESATRGYTKVTLTADWVRYEQDTTVFTGSASELFDFGLLPITYSTSTTLAVEFYAWGGQSNIGSTAKPYFPTTDRLNVPRLTYQNGGGGCPSLLLEKQSTNLLTYSEQFDNAAWLGQGIKTANTAISPDGTQNADSLSEVATFATQSAASALFSYVSGNSYTYTIYAKNQPNGRGFIQLAGYQVGVGATDVYANFNLNTGVIGSQSSGTSSIQSMGNGWYRCVFTFVCGVTSSERINICLVTSATSVAFESYMGNITKGLYIWGAQVEASSYPTSYIPTTSASATRVADACFKTGATALIGQNEGTFFVETEYDREGASASARKLISANDGSSANLVDIYVPSGQNTLQARIRANSTTLGGINTSTVPLGKVKIAYAYKANDYVLYINGAQIGTVTTGGSITFSSAVSTLQIGDGEAGADELTGKIGQAVLFPTRLTNAELASLTTL